MSIYLYSDRITNECSDMNPSNSSLQMLDFFFNRLLLSLLLLSAAVIGNTVVFSSL